MEIEFWNTFERTTMWVSTDIGQVEVSAPAGESCYITLSGEEVARIEKTDEIGSIDELIEAVRIAVA